MQKTRGIVFGVFLVSLILAVSVAVVAKPDFVFMENPAGNSFEIPGHAVQISEGVFSLGTARDVDGRLVEGFMFIHDNRRENAKPDNPGGGKGEGKKSGDSKCYAFLAKGAKWKETEPYITGSGVDLGLLETSVDTWDSEVLFDIFGAGSSGTTNGADTVSPDDKNEVMLENLGVTSTIAYTIVWGIFSGPPRGRELVEWDMVFNIDYAFGDADINPSVMDFQNIATHELGHSVGLGHPKDTCTEETMYAFAAFNETKKRDLNAGDIAGVNDLY